MLLKFSASYADLHLFTPNSAPLPHPEAVTLFFILFRVPNSGIGGCERADRCPQGIQIIMLTSSNR